MEWMDGVHVNAKLRRGLNIYYFEYFFIFYFTDIDSLIYATLLT